MSYKRLGDYIQPVNIRNKDLEVTTLLGVSVKKVFIPSIANTVGTDFKKYKKVKKHQFVYIPDTSRRGDKIGIAMLEEYEKALVSQAYTVFEVLDKTKLLPEYLMMWFRRPEFDRYARFKSHGSVREIFDWDEVCDIKLPIPSIEKQREIVAEYNTVSQRIKLNETINQKLEETAQALYKHWFVDFEFPNEEGKPYKSSGGEMVYNEELDKEIPKGWRVKKISEVANLKYGKMLNSSLFTKTGYPVFSGYGLRGYYKEYMYEDSQILVLCRGVSGTGRVEMSPKYSYITNLSIVVEVDENQLGKGYYYYYLKNDNLRTLDSGSAQAQITTGDLGFHKTLIPSKLLQNKFNEIFNITANKIDVIKEEKQLLNELQSVLLSKMSKVEGEKEMV